MALQIAFQELENLLVPDREPRIASCLRNEFKGWTAALSDRNLAQLATVIAWVNEGKGPDLLGVCEVENRFWSIS